MNHHTARYFSAQTKKQIEIANDLVDSLRQELMDNKDSLKSLSDLISQSLKRDSGWKEYYQQEMNRISETDEKKHVYSIMEKERAYENAAYNRNYEKACIIVSDIINSYKDNPQEQAWYKQILARYKFFISEIDSIRIQKTAFEKNSRLLYPQNGIDYKKWSLEVGNNFLIYSVGLKSLKVIKKCVLKARLFLTT